MNKLNSLSAPPNYCHPVSRTETWTDTFFTFPPPMQPQDLLSAPAKSPTSPPPSSEHAQGLSTGKDPHQVNLLKTLQRPRAATQINFFFFLIEILTSLWNCPSCVSHALMLKPLAPFPPPVCQTNPNNQVLT